VNKQPNSDNCFVCGIKSAVGLRLVFEDDGESVVQSRFEIPSALQGYPGIAHGGVVAAALDEAMGRVAMIKTPNRFTMTVRMEVTYRQPVPVETPVSVIGAVVKLRGRVVQARGELRLADGSVAVEAEATLVDVPGGMFTEGRFDALGWRVVPDEQAE
jgi:acyl-coenzyme A thioesterase PaaI-like protein